MFKLLTIGVLIYLIYRFTVKPSMIDASAENSRIKTKDEADDGDFVEYEEVDE